MRFPKVGLVLLLLVSFGGAADKNAPVTVRGENKAFRIEATLYKDHAQVERLLGSQLEKGIVVVAVTITPRDGQPFKVWRDDFILRSDKDGQKSEPYDPGQIAGNTVITLIYSNDGGDVAQEQQGPGWGGLGGGIPGRLPGGPTGVGNTGSVERASDTEVSDNPDSADNPLLRTLRERVLPEEEITEPTSGLLYYPLEGKHKTKQIWLHYVGEGGKIDLQFKKPK